MLSFAPRSPLRSRRTFDDRNSLLSARMSPRRPQGTIKVPLHPREVRSTCLLRSLFALKTFPFELLVAYSLVAFDGLPRGSGKGHLFQYG